MPKSFAVEFGWCGFGRISGEPQIFCLGFIAVCALPLPIKLFSILLKCRESLREAREDLRKGL